MVNSEQQAVIDFLERGTAWPGASVGRISTSLSEVFLTGDDVYKLKRAVSLPYVDFSTVDARHAACEREVALNRRTAPELYLGTVPVTRQADGLALGGDGDAVDWLVHMRRFAEADLFHHMAADGRLSDSHIIALADRLAAFHLSLPPIAGQWGAEALEQAIDGVVTGVNTNGAPLAADIGHMADQWRRALKPLAPRIDARRQHGYVRQCHGDLHLANICLIDGQPRLFDCIEFNDDLAVTDTAYDMAFTVMDLIAHGQPGHANHLLNRCLALTLDYHALPLLPVYMAARALIRAGVNALEARLERGHRAAAETYLETARNFLSANQPRLIAVAGRSGTGKSTLAGALAPLVGRPPGAIWLRTDMLRKKLLGAAPEDRLPEAAYRAEVTQATYRRMLRIAERALRAGWPVILDAVFLKEEERHEAETVAHRAAVPFDGLWLDASLETRLQRVGRRSRDASDADDRVARLQEGLPSGTINWLSLDVSGELPDTLRAARERLKL